jgi:ABC-type multidrug transport system ATPase subunit
MLQLMSVSKRFSKFTAVDRIDTAFPGGQIVGLIGPNGAGKTTLLRIISTILKASSGQVLYNGFDIQANPVCYRERIGYMAEDSGLYLKLSPRQNLMFYRAFYRQTVPVSRINNYLQEYKLSEVQDKETGRLSLGTRQKILFLKSLINDPELLILDEPLNHLDPEIRIRVKSALEELSALGKLILLSSHTLAEVEDLCHTVAIVNKGRLLISGTLDTLKKRYVGRPDQSLEDIYLRIIAEDEYKKYNSFSPAGVVGT